MNSTATEITLEFTRTYATPENARKAVDAWLKRQKRTLSLRYLIIPTGLDRYGVVFVGNSAIDAGTYFDWNTIN